MIAMSDVSEDLAIDPDTVEVDDRLRNATARTPASVLRRYDVFQDRFRDPIAGHIRGVTFSWEPPAPFTYDWYRAADGMTVVLEAQVSLHRETTRPITIRTRHENPDVDVSVLRLGQTETFDYGDDCLLHDFVQDEIMAAIANGESPLWRLRQSVYHPQFVLDVLDHPFEGAQQTGYLDLEMTKQAIGMGFVTELGLLHQMHAAPSPYTWRPR